MRLWIWALVATALFFASVGFGWYGLYEAKESLRQVHERRLTALFRFEAIQKHLRANRRLVLLAFQLDPQGGLASVHERPLPFFLAQIDEHSAAIQKLLGEHTSQAVGDEETRLLDAFMEHYQAWEEHLEEVMASLRLERFPLNTMSIFVQLGEPAGEAADTALSELHSHLAEVTANDYRTAQDRYKMTLSIYFMLAVFGTVAGTFLAISTLRRLRFAFGIASGVAKSIAAGDLSQLVPQLGSDEFGQLLGDISQMRENLHRLIKDLRMEVERLGTQARHMSDVAAHASSHATIQAETLKQMALTAAELVQSIDQVESHAAASLQRTEESVTDTENSQKLICRMTEEINHVSETVGEAASQVAELDGLSTQISGIVAVIREVAEQTNLLALNAAIEAARAGEQGRGFAVVADEVRKLAERTSASTQEITGTITDIQNRTRSVFTHMTTAVERVQNGAELARETEHSVIDTRTKTSETFQAVSSISELIRTQASSTRDIVTRIDSVSVATIDLSESANSSALSASELAELARTLDLLSARFRLAAEPSS